MQDTSCFWATAWPTGVRVVLRNLETPLHGQVAAAGDEENEDERRSWAIQYHPSRLEQELWDARHVNIYDLDVTEFTRQLRQAVQKA